MHINLETDYLIIGCGAVGMAFADTLLSETNANILIVDNHHKPGGHWNDAYSFVTLHQPSTFYGVSSSELSTLAFAEFGPNEGLQELATGAEILSYFDTVMRKRFLTSGRVQYFPMCDYQGDGVFKSFLNNSTYKVQVNKKIVDSTYFKTSVPSTHTIGYEVAPNVKLIPINDLPKIRKAHKKYVVIGGGKTGIDACIWLLENQIKPDNICWIMPRDAWLIDRANTQTDDRYFEQTIGTQAAQLEAISEAASIENLFELLEKAGVLLRIDKSVLPKMFHGATVSKKELELLQSIKNVIRKGRVTSINQGQIVFEQGVFEIDEDSLYIDCSASAVKLMPMIPIFNDNLITIQTVRSFQPVFSASFIAHIEANYPSQTTEHQDKNNHLCTVVPLPNHDTDWIRLTLLSMQNQFIWSQEPDMREWLRLNRLDGFSQLIHSVEESDADRMNILKRMKENAAPAMKKLHQFVHMLDQLNECPD